MLSDDQSIPTLSNQNPSQVLSPTSRHSLHHLPKATSNLQPFDYSQDNNTNLNLNPNITAPDSPKPKKIPNEINKFDYVYSPRSTFSHKQQTQDILFQDLAIGFDPITIKILKKHFKERLGSLTKMEFVDILKDHLLSWHPTLPNREQIIIKLLSRLFDEIDLNNNGHLEWDEFTNYIIHSSNNASVDSITYKLKNYAYSRNVIDDSDFTEIVMYAIFIEKFNLIGLVQDGKSVINFYDGITCKPVKAVIDIRDTQRDIDEIEIKGLDMKAEELVKREEVNKRIKKQEHLEKLKELKSRMGKHSLSHEKTISDVSIGGELSTTHNTKTLPPLSKKEKEDIKKLNATTPEKLKKELAKIKKENYYNLQTKTNKKLTILSCEFIPEYDLLMVSSSNNKISSWKYINGEFKNVNTTNHAKIDRHSLSCAIQSTDVPQYTLTWDPIQKYLYSGQADGKILKWKLTSSKHLENEMLDFAKAKSRHDRELYLQNSLKLAQLNGGTNPLSIESTTTKVKKTKKTQKNILLNLNTSESTANKAKLLKQQMRKRDSVSCIVMLGKLQLLAAGYYNGEIILWDPMLKDYRKYYNDQETGIYQLIYEPTKNLLFSCGFDHGIFIYDPYIDGSAVYKLVGHNSSINSVAVNPSENELVSIDINGIIKIWDLNNYYNYQTINLNESYADRKLLNDIQNSKKKKISSNLKMIYLTGISKILTYGDKFTLFEKNTSQNPDLCDDEIVLGCTYNPISYEIITVCLRKIKVWNLFNGKVKKVYEDPMNSEITAYAFDQCKKRVYIGDTSGKIKNFNMNNGNFLKDFESHNKEIVSLIYSDKLEMLISFSPDFILKFHEDKELLETSLLKELNLLQMNVKSINAAEHQRRLLLGSSTGQVKFYDYEHLRFDSECENAEDDKKYNNDEVVRMCPLGHMDVAFVTHDSGRARFMIIPPCGLKNNTFCHITNILHKDDMDIPSCMISYTYDEERYMLYIGDIFGYVNCFDIKPIKTCIDQTNGVITEQTMQLFDKVSVNKIFTVQANKEPVKHIFRPELKPSVLFITTNDRKVKIITTDKGEYIDELKQISSKYKDVPIGIKYYYADPFLSKRNEDEPEITGIISREDIDKYHPSHVNKDKLRSQVQKIDDYAKIVTQLNAKEKLYYITRGCEVGKGMSNNWNLEIDLNYIMNKETETFEPIYKEVSRKSERMKRAEFEMQNLPLSSEQYRPIFIDEMPEEKVKEFSTLLSQKLRHAKLSMAKVKLNRRKYGKNEDDEDNKVIIPLATNSGGDNSSSSNRHKDKLTHSMALPSLNKQHRRIRNLNDRFISYKEDFDRKITELESTIEERIKSRVDALILPKISKHSHHHHHKVITEVSNDTINCNN